MTKHSDRAPIPAERIEKAIYLFRGQKVMLDRDLANLYGVETKVLKQAVKRNAKRFPDDFVFVLDKEEIATLRSQIVTSKGEQRRNGYGVKNLYRYQKLFAVPEAEAVALFEGIPFLNGGCSTPSIRPARPGRWSTLTDLREIRRNGPLCRITCSSRIRGNE